MSTTADTFAGFVDVLADTLDDHEASGEVLASRLHLSRFHCDRLVSVDGIDRDPTLRSLLTRLVGQLAMWDAATHDRP